MVLAWEPLTDLPEDWSALTDGELKPLLQLWNDQRADLDQSGALSTFTQRLSREWAIETGQIEGVYNIDRGITETLIKRGIQANLIPSEPGQRSPELIAAIIQDHLDVLEGLFQFIKGDRELTKGYVHELHAGLLRHQDTYTNRDQFGNLVSRTLLKGKFKDQPNRPTRPDGIIHQYAPPEQVDSEMERLLDLHCKHEKRGVPVEVEAAWLHHRFTQIHPYQDGNGRVARALASLIFMKAGWFPVVVTRDDRTRYIDALEAADEGDLRPLVGFFVDVERLALFQATQSAAKVQPAHTVEEAIAAAKRVLASPGTTMEQNILSKAKESADHLINIAEKRLQETGMLLQKEIGDKVAFQIGKEGAAYLIGLPYSENTFDYGAARNLHLKSPYPGSIQIHGHAIGSPFRGVIGIVATLQRNPISGVLVSKQPFQVNYVEDIEAAERRFRPWLEQSLVNAITLWRKTL